MKKLFITTVFLTVLASCEVCMAQAEAVKEYQKKAEYSYNFLKFVDWPIEVFDGNEIIVGIIGKTSCVSCFDSLNGRRAKHKTVTVRQFQSFENNPRTGMPDETAKQAQIESMKKCHLIFISSSESDYVKDILGRLNGENILTVGETENFLSEGGIINFVIDGKKVRFEINLEASDKTKLKISSQLLQVARKVIKPKN